MDARRVTLGRVAGVYGVRGWIKVVSFTRPLENLLTYRQWWIDRGEGFEAQVVEGRLHGRGMIAQISGRDGTAITDRDQAAALVGAEIQVWRSQMPPAPEGQMYWADLIGMKVLALDGTALGVVENMTSNGAQDVMVIRDGEVERLIPFVTGPIVQQVDAQNRTIVCDWLAEYG